MDTINHKDNLGVKIKDWLYISIIILAILGGVLFFVISDPTYNWYQKLRASNELGDALGGITSPFINLVGAILVYVAFKAQNRANKLQKDSLEREITRAKRLEISRQVESTVQDVSIELESFSLNFEEYIWGLNANGPKANTHSYIKNGETKAGTGTYAIELASILLGSHQYWNTVNTNPQGKVPYYYKFDVQLLNQLFIKIRYIQLLLKLAATHLSSLPEYQSDPIYLKAKAFYTTKLGLSMDLFCERLNEANGFYKNEMKEFSDDHQFIHNFFGSYDNDSTLYRVVLHQREAFMRTSN